MSIFPLSCYVLQFCDERCEKTHKMLKQTFSSNAQTQIYWIKHRKNDRISIDNHCSGWPASYQKILHFVYFCNNFSKFKIKFLLKIHYSFTSVAKLQYIACVAMRKYLKILLLSLKLYGTLVHKECTKLTAFDYNCIYNLLYKKRLNKHMDTYGTTLKTPIYNYIWHIFSYIFLIWVNNCDKKNQCIYFLRIDVLTYL